MSNWNPDSSSQPPNQPNPQQPPYQPPPGGSQPPAPQQGGSPYGQPAPGGSGYGEPGKDSSPYGGNAPGAYQGEAFNGGAYGGPTGSLKRPGTVTAAVFITYISTVIVGLISVIGAVLSLAGAGALEDAIRDEIDGNPDLRRQLEDAGADATDAGTVADFVIGALIVVAIIMVVWCLIAFVLAVFTGRGSNGARITLVVSCVVTILLTLISFAAIFTLIFTLAALATAILLFTGGANDWFRNKKIAKLQGR